MLPVFQQGSTKKFSYLISTIVTLYFLDGALTCTTSHFFFHLNATPRGDSKEIVPLRISTSPPPTIVSLASLSLSSLIVTREPYLTSLPHLAPPAIISTFSSVVSISEILASRRSLSDIAVSYSAFSEISHCEIASFNLSNICGSFSSFSKRSSSNSFSYHSLVR